jgi:ADP-ribosylation factor GTPase-activating protein 1
MDSKSQEVFNTLFDIPENKVCYECNQPSNQWASVNNGVFLCLSCSGLHRGFGVNVSFVRSVTMDSWSDLQLSMMKQGGNKKLREFFEYYKMPKDAPVDFKYKTKAGFFYRELLKAQAEGKDAPPAPSEVEGLELVGNIAPPTNMQPGSMQGFGSSPTPESSGLSFDKVKAVTMGALTTAATATKNAANTVGNKVKDPEFQQSVKDFGSKIGTETKAAAGIAVEQTKKIAKELPGMATKGLAAVKTGWGSALSFIKEKTGTGQPAPQQGIVVDNGSYQEFHNYGTEKKEEVQIKDEGNADIKSK